MNFYCLLCSIASVCDGTVGGLPLSVISIHFAAQNGYAKLMGLTPWTTENEGLDSGLGDGPPTSEKKTHSSTDDVESVQKAASPCKTRGKKRVSKLESSLYPFSDNVKQEPLRKFSRKNQKEDLESEHIFEQKPRKSVEKVAEWLMNVPSEGSIELEKPDQDGGESDSSSSTSTVSFKQHMSDMNAKREDRAKVLEEQVFGAIYKRERRGNRATFPPFQVNVEPPATTETQTPEMFSNKRKREVLIPARSCEKNSFEDKKETEEKQQTMEQNNTIEENGIDKYGKELSDVPESDKIESSQVIFCPVSHIEQHQPETNKTMFSALPEVDSDLREQAMSKSENTEQRKMDQRKGKNRKSEKAKSSRAPKPLVLVGVQTVERSPKITTTAGEIQAQIESYSSSEDVPVIRHTRRSRRLHFCAEEVQDGHKKVNVKNTVPEKVGNAPEQSEEAKGGTLDDSASAKNGNVAKVAKRNGCVYDQGLGGIESLDPVERPSRPVDDCKDFVADTPVAEPFSQASLACNVAADPRSTSPTVTAAAGPRLECENPSNDFSENVQLENCAVCENEDKDDSELDTEQLLRSFKATKRKSFHLGGPDIKQSRSLDDETDQGAETEEKSGVCLGVRPTKYRACGESNREVIGDKDNSSCSDVISPSYSPGMTRKSVHEKRVEMMVEGSKNCSGQDGAAGYSLCRTSVSTALSPSKVSKHEAESLNLSVVPQVVDSGLDEINEASQATDSTMRHTGEGTVTRDSIAGRKHEGIIVPECSLTPDGLVTSAAQRSSSNSGQSSIGRKPRKKSKAQRLESSPDSDSSESEEELPSLNQIFGTSAPPAVILNQGASNEPACPSPDSVNASQASVDLFGTPQECE